MKDDKGVVRRQQLRTKGILQLIQNFAKTTNKQSNLKTVDLVRRLEEVKTTRKIRCTYFSTIAK